MKTEALGDLMVLIINLGHRVMFRHTLVAFDRGDPGIYVALGQSYTCSPHMHQSTGYGRHCATMNWRMLR